MVTWHFSQPKGASGIVLHIKPAGIAWAAFHPAPQLPVAVWLYKAMIPFEISEETQRWPLD